MRIGAYEIGLCVRAADGYADGGDAVVVREAGGVLLVVVLDVLGHGPEAHRVAQRAEGALEAIKDAAGGVKGVLDILEARLGGTLGAAVGAAGIDLRTGAGTFAGVGNTVARLMGRADRRLGSVDGVVGQSRAVARENSFVFASGDTLVMHTDGVSSRFALEEYPQLGSDEPGVAAREVVRRFGRAYDDAACVVVRSVP